MLVTSDTAASHVAFVAWLNAQLDNPTAQPEYAVLVQNLAEVLAQGLKAHVTLVELYTAQNEQVAFLVFSAVSTAAQRVVVFSPAGVPLAYNEGDSAEWLRLTDRGLVAGFDEGEVLNLFVPALNPWGSLTLYTEVLWGTRLPFIRLDRPAGELGRGMVDVHFPERLGGSYALEVQPPNVSGQYQVTNRSGQVLDLALPIFPHYVLRQRLAAGEAIEVAVTESSTYALKQLRNKQLVTYVPL